MLKTFQKLCEVIPGGVNSPVRACRGLLDEPLIAKSGSKDTFVDIDGNEYIDYCCSFGALIHGHAHPAILDPVRKRMEKGTSFGLSTEVEERLARELVNIVDGVDSVRFVSSGTEAVMSAIRLARGYTQRDKIIKFTGNYHGHADYLLVKAGSAVGHLPQSSSAGVPKECVKNTLSLPYNDIEAFKEAISEEAAAVVLEPVAGNMGVVPASSEFISTIRKCTKETGALLIFDEVITGFRVGLKGAGALYDTIADLTCFGKIIGGGFNVGAFGGRKEIMDYLAPLGPVFQAGTLSGNPVAMEAGVQSLKLLQAPGFYEELERKIDILVNPLQELIQKKNLPLALQRAGSMFSLFFGKRKVSNFADAHACDQKKFQHFFRTLIKQGIYIPPSYLESWFISSVHSDKHLEKTRDVVLKYIDSI